MFYVEDYGRREKVARTGFELPTLSWVDRDLSNYIGYEKCSVTYYEHSMAST